MKRMVATAAVKSATEATAVESAAMETAESARLR
jgi:hypothetical protein